MAKNVTFMDGFDRYTTDQIKDKWDNMSNSSVADRVTIDPTGGRDGDGCLVVNRSYGNFVSKAISPTDKVVLNFAFKPMYANTSYWTSFLVFMGLGQGQLEIARGPDGTIGVFKYASTTPLITGPVLANNTWHHLHIKVKLGTATSSADGFAEIIVNNTTTLLTSSTLVNRTVATIPIDQVLLGGRVPVDQYYTSEFRFDDFYIIETTDPITDTYIKDRKVKSFVPSNFGSINDFVGSDGNAIDNHLLVNELINSDTSFIQSGTIDSQQTFYFNSLPNIAKVDAIQTVARVRKSDTGDKYLTPIYKGSSLVELPSLDGFSVNWTVQRSIANVNPLTGLAFSNSDMQNLELGFKIKQEP